MTCWVDPQSSVALAPNEAARGVRDQVAGDFFCHRAEMGVWFGFHHLLTLIIDAPLSWNEVAEQTNISTWSQRSEVSLYAVSPPSLRRGETCHHKPGREERLKNQDAYGGLFISRAARYRLTTAAANNFKPGEMKGQCNSRCRVSFTSIASAPTEEGGRRRAEARSMVVTERLRPRLVAPAVTNSSPHPPPCLRS